MDCYIPFLDKPCASVIDKLHNTPDSLRFLADLMEKPIKEQKETWAGIFFCDALLQLDNRELKDLPDQEGFDVLCKLFVSAFLLKEE